jgi:hypothetical protein
MRVNILAEHLMDDGISAEGAVPRAQAILEQQQISCQHRAK